MSVFQLCQELGMTKAELIHGRGARMTAHELCVEWPIYNRLSNELQSRLQELEGTVPPEQFDRQFELETMGGGG